VNWQRKMNKVKNKKPFYYQFIHFESLIIEVKKAGLSNKEEKEILDLIEHSFHTRAIDAVLERLPEDKQEEFIKMYARRPADEDIFDYLKKNIKDIENHLKKALHNLQKEILKEFNR
jgi:DNA-directed RNA polymerase specialized sigma24 family protein